MDKKYEDSCKSEFNCEEVTMTKQELIEELLENVSEGACLGCSISDLFDIAYNQGRLDTLGFYKVMSEDLMNEDFNEDSPE